MTTNLLPNIKMVRVMNAVAAGVTDQTSSTIDMQGFDGVVVFALVGAIVASAVTYLKLQQSADDVTYNDLASSKVSILVAEANSVAIEDLYRPAKRYVKVVLSRATANATIDGIIAVLYRGRKYPVALSATTVAASKVLVSPAEGVA